ncbi:DUF2398 family protein [Saccharopolyspora cebuensis]|uniref:DUF2398 family protein n=1 Tax=Saccharopolyspora cebuensis TaxID=418759 RepID=A0ABV4CJM8_9PSEU
MNRDAAERQRAFTALLRSPVLDRRAHPELWSLVRVHRAALGEWFSHRLGYRLVITDSAARLFRLPVEGAVLAPRRFRPPTRRVLVLAILGAAAAEDAEDITTTQDLSDRVRALSTHEDVTLAPYDPDRFAERTLFVKAVQILVSVGALRPTGRDYEQQREGWAHHRDPIGGAYEVHRELLLRMVDPTALRSALPGGHSDVPPHESAARFSLMRRLIELPVLFYDDLTDAERTYLASQRHRVLAWCAEMTGWTIEQRAEGMALIAADEGETDLPFPKLRATDFATLMVLDELIRRHGTGVVITSEHLGAAAAEVRDRYPKAMTNDLRVGTAVESEARHLLIALDLLRPTDSPEKWLLTTVAARYRNPRVVAVNARLDEEAQA